MTEPSETDYRQEYERVARLLERVAGVVSALEDVLSHIDGLLRGGSGARWIAAVARAAQQEDRQLSTTLADVGEAPELLYAVLQYAAITGVTVSFEPPGQEE